MHPEFIGRHEERKLLEELYEKESAELVSVTGRRRVGKTHLINTVFEHRIDFHLTGTQSKSMDHQLKNFAFIMGSAKGTRGRQVVPKDWQQAFFELTWYLEDLKKEEKLVVFFDELPWLATARSGFLSAFSFFWNSWAEKHNILVIICGSAASWMINKVVRNKGGLHNRITKRIQLEPFNLSETSEFLLAKGFNFHAYSFVELYMILGGIPHYLKELEATESNVQNIDRICFASTGLLYDEFDRLYPAPFEQADKQIDVIRVLANHVNGLNRSKIIQLTGLSDGGSVKRILEELEFSGFIKSFYAFNKKRKGKIYRLVDEYSLFYIRFIENRKIDGTGAWISLSQSQAYSTWRGYAFENVGLKHISQIKKALGILGISTTVSTFYHKGNDLAQGLQIDLIIDRADRAINLCEFKFYNEVINLSTEQVNRLQQRRQDFQQLTSTKSVLYNTLISTYGIKHGSNKGGVVSQSITIEAFFE